VAESGALDGLRHFSLQTEPLTEDDLRGLAGCAGLEGLVGLNFHSCRLGPVGMLLLAGAPWLAGLQTLELLGNHVIADGADSLASVPFRRLTELNVQANYIRDEGLARLAASGHALAHLTRLNLRYNNLSATGLAALLGNPTVAGLRQLHLRGNALGNAGAAVLADCAHLAGLRELDLDQTGITDEGAVALAGSPHLAGLVALDLAQNAIVNEGIVALCRSPHLTRLTRLQLASWRPLAPDVLRVYQERFPGK
jgi:Ran GTPase-activating protein (RanGAP) involved in mRNA processing and transport